MSSTRSSSFPSKAPAMAEVMTPSSFRLSVITTTTQIHTISILPSILPTTPPSTSYSELPTPPPTPPLAGNPKFTSAMQKSSALHILPPELLLAIISHLPSTSYLPLSRTSSSLHTFFATHAATICSTRILSHHSREASILCALPTTTPSGTWLLPTHPSVVRAEEGLWDVEGLVPSLRPKPLNQPAIDFQKRLRLTEPGPQFLLFLERRGWEVHTRHLMMQDKKKALQDGTDAGWKYRKPWGGELSRELELMDQYLSWTLERGSVRGFLEELGHFSEAFVGPLSSIEVTESEEEQHLEEIDYCVPHLGKRMAKRLRNKMKKLQMKLERFCTRKMKKVAPPEPEKRALLFGEIEIPANEKVDFSASKGGDSSAYFLEQGLLWYHSHAGVGGFRYAQTEKEITVVSTEPSSVEHKNRTIRERVRAVNGNAAMMRWKPYGALRSWKCGRGSFESLD